MPTLHIQTMPYAYTCHVHVHVHVPGGNFVPGIVMGGYVYIYNIYTRVYIIHTQVPGDNFVPGIVMGGLSGRLFGELLREAAIHPGLTPGAFALLGAGAVPASVLR